MLQNLCQHLPNAAIVMGVVSYSAAEWFMGKTKFGSMIGMVIEHPLQWFIDQFKKT